MCDLGCLPDDALPLTWRSRLRQDTSGMSFRRVPRPRDDDPTPCLLESYGPSAEGSGPQGEESRNVLNILRARILAAMKMAVPKAPWSAVSVSPRTATAFYSETKAARRGGDKGRPYDIHSA